MAGDVFAGGWCLRKNGMAGNAQTLGHNRNERAYRPIYLPYRRPIDSHSTQVKKMDIEGVLQL